MEKKICEYCYRELDENMIINKICLTCKSIIGKGDGYKNTISDEEANEWFKGTSERKEELRKQNKL